jgi:putative ABC transport system permease protein
MKTTTLARVAIESIRKNTMRTLLTMLGIVIGVAAVIVMVAIGEGATSRIEQQINSLGTNMLVITAGASARGGVSQGAQTFNRLTIADAQKLQREATLVSAVSPVIFTRSQIIGGEGNWRAMINGVDANYTVIRDWGTSSGAFFTDADVAAMRKVALLGNTVAEALFPGIDPVGQQVQLRNVPFTVIGVLAKKGQTAGGSDQDDIVLVPYTTAQTRLSGFSFIGQIIASAASPAQVTAAQEELRVIMHESHKLGDADDDFTVRNQNELAEAATSTTEVMSWLLAAIASISLIVGGIGIMNIMLVSVTERTREIGLRKAVGARPSAILLQFLVEAVVLCLFGGLMGTAIGQGLTSLISKIPGARLDMAYIPLWAIGLSFGFAGSVGVFFGMFPAIKAARLDPIEALRHE